MDETIRAALQTAIMSLAQISLTLLEGPDEEEEEKDTKATLDSIIDEAEADTESIELTDVANRAVKASFDIGTADDIIAARGMIDKISQILKVNGVIQDEEDDL